MPIKRLLDHPFYQAWHRGEVRPAQLARYARSYREFIDRMPEYWQRIGDGLAAATAPIVADERRHAALWLEWAEALPATDSFPRMTGVLELFDSLPADALLGAVQSFEEQQPDVARTKREGLIGHYGFGAAQLGYFDAHLDEAAHLALGAAVAARLADRSGYERGYREGAEALYHSLDLFVA